MDAGAAVILKAIERQRATKHIIDLGDSPVQLFYRNAVVFITGGSGFLGKQLIEKLLRNKNERDSLLKELQLNRMDVGLIQSILAEPKSVAAKRLCRLIAVVQQTCKIKKIFVLMRAKKGKSVQERLNEILNDPLYDILRTEKPDFGERIVPIVGELSEKDLAISERDRETIVKEIDVIFHVAATISFSEPLRSATLTNVRGTRDLITLAKQCKKIRCFIHMSTAYSHATYSRRDTEVMEQFYPSPMPPLLMIQLAETVDEDRINRIKDGMITDWPNTYSFTKALAEELVRTSAGDLPICVIRPSVVTCARREPYAGWVDHSSVYGPSGITLGSMMGVIHTLHSHQEIRIDFVPVDYVNNTAILAAANAREGVKIYTLASSCRNHITWGGLTNILNNVARQTIVSPQALWYCFVVQTPHRWIHQIFCILLHTVPANLVDWACVILGKPPRLKKIYSTITKMATTIAFYTNNNWIFNDDNTVELYQSLSENDKVIYHCDITDMEWVDHIVLWCVGLRKYIVKDGLITTEKGMKKQFYCRIATYVITAVFIYFILMLLCYLCLFIKYVFGF